MSFLGENYLLKTESGKVIFREISHLPIIDIHTHINAEDLAKNRGWGDIWEVEAATDHYVWELMRRASVPEQLITGDAPSREKWFALASVFPRFAGNPVYEWLHLDLNRRFGIEKRIDSKTALEIWNETKEKLALPQFRPQQLLREMNVAVLCTTESPLSDLKWHVELSTTFPEIKVLPTWRPDDVVNVGSQEWRDFIVKLGERTDVDITRLTKLIEALEKTHCYFAEHGCIASDHALAQPWGHYVSQHAASKIYEKAWYGLNISEKEHQDFQAFMLHVFAELDAKAGWIMQLHIGAVRDYRDLLYKSLGRDSGGDVATHNVELVHNLNDFLNEYDGKLRIIIYVLHPSHMYTIATLARAFSNVYVGAPWWFMDNPYHIANSLKSVAAVDLLWRHAGMVTDSRKIIAIAGRIEMFRRVLAEVLGEMVDQHRVPLEVACDIARQVTYFTPKSLVKEALRGC